MLAAQNQIVVPCAVRNALFNAMWAQRCWYSTGVISVGYATYTWFKKQMRPILDTVDRVGSGIADRPKMVDDRDERRALLSQMAGF